MLCHAHELPLLVVVECSIAAHREELVHAELLGLSLSEASRSHAARKFRPHSALRAVPAVAIDACLAHTAANTAATVAPTDARAAITASAVFMTEP